MRIVKLLSVFFAILLAMASGSAFSRNAVPIENHDSVVITSGSGKKLTADQVKSAIVKGASAHQWTVSQAGTNVLLATLEVRGKHTAVVEIAYTATNYSVKYKDSKDLKYSEQEGVPVIHPFYNKWVRTFMDDISTELKKL